MSFERTNIKKMQGYSPGEQPQSGDFIKLNTNENPYPPSPAVAATLQSFAIDSLRSYPPPLADNFREAAANLHQVSRCNILPTNGGDELLRLVVTTFTDKDDTIVITQPSYSLFPVLADVQACNLVEIPLQSDWTMPENFFDELQSVNAKMAILVNPHAPTGMLLGVNYLADLVNKFSGVVVIDEAYVDFVDPSCNYNTVPLIDSHENLLILRTLSKGYSLAGLRFGYGIGAESLINPMLYKTRDSYNTDIISQQLATAALQSVDYAAENWAKIRAARNDLADSLNELGFATLPSQSNFLLCQIPATIGANNMYLALKSRKILVRYFDQDKLRDKLRISVGNENENAALLAAIRDITTG